MTEIQKTFHCQSQPLARKGQYRDRPAHLLKPGSRAAWAKGCQCYTLPGLQAEGRDQHQAQCPLSQTQRNLRQKETER